MEVVELESVDESFVAEGGVGAEQEASARRSGQTHMILIGEPSI